MRVVLVLCLLAFMSFKKDIMDIAKCLYESPKVKEIIADIMVAIVTKDFSKLWPKIKEALPVLIPILIKCITENEANLQAIRPIMNKWNDWMIIYLNLSNQLMNQRIILNVLNKFVLENLTTNYTNLFKIV